MFLFLLFLHSFLFLFLPCPSLSSPLLSLLSFFSLSLGDDTKWPTRVDVSLNPNSIKTHINKRAMGSRVIRACCICSSWGKGVFVFRFCTVICFFPSYSFIYTLGKLFVGLGSGLYPGILGKGPWAKLGKNYLQNTKIGNTISSEKCQEQNLILCCSLDWLMPVGSDLHAILA